MNDRAAAGGPDAGVGWAPEAAAARPWRRLDPKMILIAPLRRLSPVVLPALVVFLFSGRGGGQQLVTLVVAGVVAVSLAVAGVASWATTRYRVTADRVELRSGLVLRKRLSVPRDRIRTVDVTAKPLLRIMGLASVVVGTGLNAGPRGSSELTLDGVPARAVEELRLGLLDRTPTRPVDGLAGAVTRPVPTPRTDSSSVVATLDWSWLRFAPLTLSGLLALAAVVGGGFNLLGSLGVDFPDVGTVEHSVAGVESSPLWLVVTVAAVVVLLSTALAAVLWYVEAWWRYVLVREPGGTFLLRRGLLTTRSVSIEEKRLRGVEIAEPLLLRLGRGARASAVASGLKSEGGFGNAGSVLPPAPRAQAYRLAGAMLAEPELPDHPIALHRHPGAALRRRLVRRLLPVAVTVGVLGAVEPTRPWAWLAAVVGAPPAVALAVDAYRGLGHRRAGSCVVVRRGSVVRRTVALRRNGVIGWNISQSPFQRRAGIATVTATTAARGGAVPVVDVGLGQGLAFAIDTVPGLLDPFVVTNSESH